MITVVKVGSGYVQTGRKEFLIDSASDAQNLPTNQGAEYCAPGSIAYTPDLKSIYILGNDNTWHQVEN